MWWVGGFTDEREIPFENIINDPYGSEITKMSSEYNNQIIVNG